MVKGEIDQRKSICYLDDMAQFESSTQLKNVLGGFFRYLGNDEELSSKLLKSKLILKFNYREPEASLTVDLRGDQVIVLEDDSTLEPDVEMAMKADTAHKFWLGKVNLVVALTRREITAKGPIPKILKLLPIIKPAYKLYPQYLKENGMNL